MANGATRAVASRKERKRTDLRGVAMDTGTSFIGGTDLQTSSATSMIIARHPGPVLSNQYSTRAVNVVLHLSAFRN